MSNVHNTSHITEKYPLAHSIHRTSHRLSLATCDTCNVQSIRNFTGTIPKVCVNMQNDKMCLLLDVIERVCPITHNITVKGAVVDGFVKYFYTAR